MDTLMLEGQDRPHGCAVLYGTHEALVALRDTLTHLLGATNANDTTSLRTFASDGEGYDIFIYMMDDDTIAKIPPYYADDLWMHK